QPTAPAVTEAPPPPPPPPPPATPTWSVIDGVTQDECDAGSITAVVEVMGFTRTMHMDGHGASQTWDYQQLDANHGRTGHGVSVTIYNNSSGCRMDISAY